MGENEDSMIFKFFKLQLDQPTKGDWVSACQKDLDNLEINQTFEDIKNMPTISFKKLVKSLIQTISHFIDFEHILINDF